MTTDHCHQNEYYQSAMERAQAQCAKLTAQQLSEFAMEAKLNLNAVGLDVDNVWFLAVFADSIGPGGWAENQDCAQFAELITRAPSDAERLAIRDGHFSAESSDYYQQQLERAQIRCRDLTTTGLVDLDFEIVDQLQAAGLFRDSDGNLVNSLWLLEVIIARPLPSGEAYLDCWEVAEELLSLELS